jgi:hypothetical protein
VDIVYSPHPVRFTSAFTVHPSDTNLFGFSASLFSASNSVQARFTDINSIVQTATCSAQIRGYYSVGYIDYITVDGVQQRVTSISSDTETAYGSVLCPIANTQIGTGPLTVYVGDNEIQRGGAYAMYFGQTTATVTPVPTQTTIIVPG